MNVTCPVPGQERDAHVQAISQRRKRVNEHLAHACLHIFHFPLGGTRIPAAVILKS